MRPSKYNNMGDINEIAMKSHKKAIKITCQYCKKYYLGIQDDNNICPDCKLYNWNTNNSNK